jgi:hypothetical protein
MAIGVAAAAVGLVGVAFVLSSRREMTPERLEHMRKENARFPLTERDTASLLDHIDALEAKLVIVVNELAVVKKDIGHNTAMTAEMHRAIIRPIGAILSAKPVQAAAIAVLLAALGAAGAMLQNHATGPLVAPAPVLTDGGK